VYVCVRKREREREREKENIKRVPMLLMSTTPTNGFFLNDPCFITWSSVWKKKLFLQQYCRALKKDNLDLLDRRKTHKTDFTFFFIYKTGKFKSSNERQNTKTFR